MNFLLLIPKIKFLHFRNSENPKVWTSLSEYHKNRRSQICQVRIKVNIIAWLVEFSGCLTVAIHLLLVGSRTSAVSGILDNVTLMCFFILLPCTFVIYSSEGINTIVDNNWGDALKRLFEPTGKVERRGSGNEHN